MTAIELKNILISILLFGHAVCEIPILRIHSAVLEPMPYRLDDTYLLGQTLQQRKELCATIRSQIHDFVFQPKGYYYVPEAHLYKFDTETWLALQCPTFPVIYISHDWLMEKNTHSDQHQWYVRMVMPPHVEDYNFRFESALSIKYLTDKEVNSTLQSKKHIFHDMDFRMYWHLCNEARKRIRYEINIEEGYVGELPKFYEFSYEIKHRDAAVFAIHCFRAPNIYLHTNHENPDDDKLIIITLVYPFFDKYEMNPAKNVG